MNNYERQLQLEADAIENGLKLYKERSKSIDPAISGPGIEMLRASIDPLTKAIRFEQKSLCDGKARPKLPKYAAPMLSLAPDKLSLITLQCIFSAVATIGSSGSPPSVIQISSTVGERCQQERKFDILRKRARNIQNIIKKRNINHWNSKKRSMDIALNTDSDDWSKGHRSIHLGIELLNLAVIHTKLFELITIDNRRGDIYKTTKVVRLTEYAHQWLDQRHLYFEELTKPIYLPMIVPPVKWTDISGGGFLTNQHTHQINLVKNWKKPEDANIQSEANFSPIFNAVNILQETSWRINIRLYHIMKKAWTEGHCLPGLSLVRHPLPSRLPENTPIYMLSQHKAERARIHRTNAKVVADRETMRMRIHICEKLEHEERLYFPYQLDNRGRAYPIPQIFNPQSNDSGRALLEFADGKPLGSRGVYWLAVHLANTYGYDKVSFDHRVKWVEEHQTEIRDSAENPLEGNYFWKGADKPWCFLAACLEWVDYCSIGSDFQSHLPISMDGTCNGLQHFSAMARDIIGGKATNLISSDKPNDIYQEVAEHVIDYIKKDERAGIVEAKQWLGRIDRKTVKRATMTTPYGVTPHGMTQQLIEEGFTSHMDDQFLGAIYLTKILEKSISQTVTSGQKIKIWLEEVTRTLAENDQNVCWTTPTGFPVIHEYRKRKARRIVTSYLTLRIYEEDSTLSLDIRKQIRSIVPNFIQSLDAAHMMLTVNHLFEKGIINFSMIHDSYGVHACDTDLLNTILREQFVRIYKEPIMDQFLNSQPNAHTNIDLPLPPKYGDLNIEDVLHSEYFFS